MRVHPHDFLMSLERNVGVRVSSNAAARALETQDFLQQDATIQGRVHVGALVLPATALNTSSTFRTGSRNKAGDQLL
jgi:hypothetical protein